MEHYCTLFDQGFLPQGLALYASLRREAKSFTLWVLCLDRSTEAALRQLRLDFVKILPLHECETSELRLARTNRTYSEYCWTLASHLFSFVLERDRAVSRLTYVDADVYFFRDPAPLIRELELSGKAVLITEHAYAPSVAHYERTAGRFCVQFITVTRNPAVLSLLATWQQQTLESCAARGAEMFGDQQYLDEWPSQYPEFVHILDHRYRTLAPWNADYALKHADPAEVIFYHFHSFRIISSRWSQWWIGYTLRHRAALHFYAVYQSEILAALETLERAGVVLARRRFRPGMLGWIRLVRASLRGRLHMHRLTSVNRA